MYNWHLNCVGVENPHIIYTCPSISEVLLCPQFHSRNSTNCRPCSTVVFITEKKNLCKWIHVGQICAVNCNQIHQYLPRSLCVLSFVEDFLDLRITEIFSYILLQWSFPGDWDKLRIWLQCRRLGFDPWWSPRGGNSNPLQYSCLENSVDREPGGLQFME